jgi:hypothetical protein
VPLPWQRSKRKNNADRHASAKVRLGRNISLGTLRPLDAPTRDGEASRPEHSRTASASQ